MTAVTVGKLEVEVVHHDNIYLAFHIGEIKNADGDVVGGLSLEGPYITVQKNDFSLSIDANKLADKIIDIIDELRPEK